jgi:hypothetical protein
MRALLFAIASLGLIVGIVGVAPEASATCTSALQPWCICLPTYYGGQGLRGGVVWRCIGEVVLP